MSDLRFERWHDGTGPVLLMHAPGTTPVIVATGPMVHHVERRAAIGGCEVFGTYERKGGDHG